MQGRGGGSGGCTGYRGGAPGLADYGGIRVPAPVAVAAQQGEDSTCRSDDFGLGGPGYIPPLKYIVLPLAWQITAY